MGTLKAVISHRLVHSPWTWHCDTTMRVEPLKRPQSLWGGEMEKNWVSLNVLWTLLQPPHPPFISPIPFTRTMTGLATKCTWIEQNTRNRKSLMGFWTVWTESSLLSISARKWEYHLFFGVLFCLINLMGHTDTIIDYASKELQINI